MASKYEEMARELAEEAMAVLHHDADEDTNARHDYDLAKKFIPIIRRGVRKAR